MMNPALRAKRILLVRLPNWPVVRLLDERPELSSQPLAVFERRSGGRRVRAASALAVEQGVRPDMPVAEAAALCGRRRLALVEHDPQADRAALVQLAQWCEQFSPTVGIESTAGQDGAEPECIVMDITGLAPLFGGERALARLVVRRFAQRHLPVRVAVADTIGTCWAVCHTTNTLRLALAPPLRVPLAPPVLQAAGTSEANPENHDFNTTSARHSPRQVARRKSKGKLTRYRIPIIIPVGETISAVANVSLRSLRLPSPLVELLESLGLRTIGQVAALPRASLTARFGPQLLARLDELTGAKSETIEAFRPPPQFEAEFEFPHPTTRAEAIDEIIQRLAHQLGRELQAQRQGALGISCRLGLDDGRVLHVSVGLYRPTARARHLAELIQMQWQQQPFDEPVSTIRLTVTASGPLETQQRELFADDNPEESRELSPRDQRRLARLMDRLSSRLGRDAVLRVRLVRDAVPEQACRVEPLTGRSLKGAGSFSAVVHRAANRRQRRESACPRSGIGAVERAEGDSPIFARQRIVAGSAKIGGQKSGQSPEKIRPLCLLPRPQTVAVVSIAPDGPPARVRLDGTDQEIVEAVGPERIETGWWRGPSVRRDYYRVTTARGARLWLFRHRNDGKWFLHGEFE